MDDTEFREQIVALLPRMRRFAYTLTSNREDADDLVQAACERALSRKHQWQPGSSLASWVFRIIYTQRIDATRSQRSCKVHLPLEDRTLKTAGSRNREKMEAGIMLRQVFESMARLSESDRAVLGLVCIEGLSYKESAATLGIAVGTVMSRLSRARQRLHKLVHAKEAQTLERL